MDMISSTKFCVKSELKHRELSPGEELQLGLKPNPERGPVHVNDKGCNPTWLVRS